MKKYYLAALIVIILVSIDFFLEYPKFGNQEIFFKKSFKTKYTYASLDFQNSLSNDEIIEIFNLILKERNSNSYCLASCFSNTAGGLSSHFYQIPFNDDLKMKIKKNWEKLNQNNIFFTSLDDITDSFGIITKNYQAAFTFSPIKKVDNRICIGFTNYRAPLGSSGGVYEIKKANGKWVIVKPVYAWIS